MNVAIVNYGMGNLKSVYNALVFLNIKVEIVDEPVRLKNFSHIILPGVGAFGKGITNIKEMGWDDSLNKEVMVSQKPILGICLGMQLIASTGFELGTFQGLGWISGTVEIIKSSKDCRIPHIGWNDVSITKDNILYKGLGENLTFYFVHSYALIPSNIDIISGQTNHSHQFVSSIEFENIFATQFHPEKSQKSGMKLLKNFTDI